MIKKINWDTLAAVYPILRKNPLSKYFLIKETKALLGLLSEIDDPGADNVIDLGVGRGHSLSLVAGERRFLAGLDISYKMLHKTRHHQRTVAMTQGDILHLPFKNASFDLALCVGVMEYIPDINALLFGISQIIRENKFLLITNSPPGLLSHLRKWNGQPIYPRKKAEVEQAFSASSFQTIGATTTPMQDQYLLKKFS
ncbi:MAG: class I SAM-dependent methyltransferase [Calditrichales bacterium]|nr:MAG: class I SAM-dependent methyltransferase [Calditrichales bacterium]